MDGKFLSASDQEVIEAVCIRSEMEMGWNGVVDVSSSKDRDARCVGCE